VVTVESIEDGVRPQLLGSNGKPVPEEPPVAKDVVADIEEEASEASA